MKKRESRLFSVHGGSGAKRFFTICLALVFAACILAGCGKGGSQTSGAGTTQTAGGLPIVTSPLTLTFFMEMDAKATVTMKDYSEIKFVKEWEKRTGITIEWRHPLTGQAADQFNLMLASGDYPDIIYYGMSGVPGGGAKLLDDGVIIKLNDLMEKNAPNFMKLMQNPQWKRDSILDDGSYYGFPYIREHESELITSAFQMRKDWLDKLGLQIPTTIDEWYKVLSAFKRENVNGQGNVIPYVAIGNSTFNTFYNFAQAYGIKAVKGTNKFYKDGNTVKFGPAQPAYRDFLTEMNKWYSEGLLDSEYLLTDDKSFASKITGHQGGAYFGMVLGYMGVYTDLLRPDNPDFEVTAVPFPLGPAGKAYGQKDINVNQNYAMVTTKCKNPVEAVRMLDYLYGEEGNLLANFGIEGESYNMVNGEPIYTDMIFHNPLPLTTALMQYAWSVSTGPMIQDGRFFLQVLVYPEQKRAVEIWGGSCDPSLNLPPLSQTPTEVQRLAAISNDLETYVDEMSNRFIMGLEPLGNFDRYINALQSMNVNEAVALYQTALERYNKR